VELCDVLHERDVWVQDTAPHSVRMVTHWNVDRTAVEKALVELRTVVKDRCASRKEKMPQS
jgi:threonine aldolase